MPRPKKIQPVETTPAVEGAVEEAPKPEVVDAIVEAMKEKKPEGAKIEVTKSRSVESIASELLKTLVKKDIEMPDYYKRAQRFFECKEGKVKITFDHSQSSGAAKLVLEFDGSRFK